MTPRQRRPFEPVTLGHIRAHGCRDILIYCNSIQCNHSARLDADWTRRSFTRGTPRGLFGSIGLMAAPVVVGEFVAHDSGLRFGSLNHAPGDAINPQRPILADANTLISLPLSGA
jgi:hypothetical protein